MFPLLSATMVPLVLVLALGVALPARREPGRTMTLVLCAGLAFLVLRYMWWRATETLLPLDGFRLDAIGILLVFLIEAAAWFDAALLYLQLARRTDRRAEADRHEARLRAAPNADLPHVDVLIATYNEPLDVLERTVIGAKSIDWPQDRLHVYLLDDGRRDWLELFADEQGVGYLTRDENAHAKAGNINAALKRTTSEFFLILDADFIPQHNMLYRMAGFFEDPKIGIVQAPHEFFNFDPLQTNLAMRASLPSDQKMFFREIMRGRDGWNCAFCCGSNSLTRRRAMEEIGGGLPTGSITEDMLLTLAFLRKGYVTRYLGERLAVGLAPESLDAFFIQRSRWAQGALQILYLKEGPLGPDLPLITRLMFLPTHWLTQSLMQVTALVLPVAYLLFGFIPMILTDVGDLFYYQFPAILASIMALWRLAPDAYYPAVSTVLSTLQSFRLLPVLLKTLVKPHGHKFRVTPKGANPGGRVYDVVTLRICLILMWGMTLGFALALWPGSTLEAPRQLFPIVSIWSVVNGLVLAAVLTVAFTRPVPRKEERFLRAADARLIRRFHGPERTHTLDISLSGARLATDAPEPGEWLALELAGVGALLAKVHWARGGRSGIEFHHYDEASRDALIARLYADCEDAMPTEHMPGNVAIGLLKSIFLPAPKPAPPGEAQISGPARDVLEWFGTIAGRAPDAEAWWADDRAERADAAAAAARPAS